MKYLNHEQNYNRYPKTKVEGYQDKVVNGYKDIVEEIKKRANGDTTIVFDCYPGVNVREIEKNIFDNLEDITIYNSEEFFYDEETITKKMESHLTTDRVRGIMYHGSLIDFVDRQKLNETQDKINNSAGVKIVYGVGASIATKGDVLIYLDLARWEIQQRYRNGLTNFKCSNTNEDILLKYKRAFFIEWRIADKHKASLYNDITYYLDTNNENKPHMISGRDFLLGLEQIASKPFRLVPYFDPGVWGGQWMKEVCDLDKEQENFAWSFDGVPEENSIYLQYGNTIIESPAMNVVKYQGKRLLGEKNIARFGNEFPIRFDFLDTMDGQNLSLQVHPTTEYNREHFGMAYTQDESYYILDAKDGGGVYLGLKENIDSKEMISALEDAQLGNSKFDADKYINFFEAKKHDHYLIPAGTVHCSSNNCMVLEVSATPYIFTFKLWDWDRVGLDGLPRPIHIEDGKKVIDWSRTTPWVKQNLVNAFEDIYINDDTSEIKTGLHELEFIETRVITTKVKTIHDTNDGVNVLNLVEGKCAIVESPTNRFEPYVVHYAETFIIPASVGQYTITPEGEGTIKVLKAYVRN